MISFLVFWSFLLLVVFLIVWSINLVSIKISLVAAKQQIMFAGNCKKQKHYNYQLISKFSFLVIMFERRNFKSHMSF